MQTYWQWQQRKPKSFGDCKIGAGEVAARTGGNRPLESRFPLSLWALYVRRSISLGDPLICPALRTELVKSA